MALKFTDLLWLPGGEKGHVVAADGKRACHVFQTQPRLEKEAPGDDSACATASNRDRGWRRSGGRPHGECGGCWRRSAPESRTSTSTARYIREVRSGPRSAADTRLHSSGPTRRGSGRTCVSPPWRADFDRGAGDAG